MIIIGLVLCFSFAIWIVLRYVNKSEYQKITNNFTKVDVKQIENNIENKKEFVLYIGRESCPSCVSFVPILNESAKDLGIEILYLDSTDTERRPDIREFRNKHNIMYVPSLVIVKENKLVFPKVPENRNDMDKIFKGFGFE